MLTALLCIPLLAAPPSIAEIDGLSAARVMDLARYDAGLKSSDVPTIVATVHAIGRLQTPTALPRLKAALAHADHRVRQAAAFAWGQLDAAPAAPLEARLKSDAAPAVRIAATQALGKLKDSAWGALLDAATHDADHAVRREARIALALQARRNDGVGHGMTAALPGWLKASAPRLRWAAAYAFRRATKLDGPTNLETALECAADADAEVRALCVRVLGRFGDLEAPQRDALDTTLLKATADQDWRVGVEAWRSAKEAKRLDVLVPSLLTVPQRPIELARQRVHVWIAGLDALLDARLPSARPVAEALFRMQIAKPMDQIALGRAHIRCRAAALLDQADGGDRLATCDPAAPKGLVATLTGAVLAALEPPQRARAIVERYAKAKTAGMRIALLDAASGLKGDAAIAALVTRGAADPDMAVFSQAATTAGALGLTSVAPRLRARIPALQAAQEYEASIAAIDALGALKDAASAPALRGLLIDSNPAVAAAAAKALTAMGQPAEARPTPREATPVARPAEARPTPREATPVARPAATRAVVQTTKGAFVIRLHAQDAPLTVANFVKLAKAGFYDGLAFHRVVGDFVVQGGDPRGDGWGGPGYAIPCEINPQRYHRGAVGMALAGKDTGGSQWFVTHAPQPHLDGRYTVFGQVEAMTVPDTLVVGDRILSVRIDPAGR